MGYVTDVRDFNYFQGYLWSPTDFENFETWLKAETQNSVLAGFGSSILEGLLASPNGGMNVLISTGAGANSDGRLCLLNTPSSVAVASPVGNPAKSLIVLRPVTTPGTPIPNPQNQLVNVNLHNFLTAQVVVIDGTPAANPVYPATQAGDIILMGLNLTAGMTTISTANFDYSQVSVPRKKEMALSEDVVSRTVTQRDEVIEANCAASGLTFTLPSAASSRGKKFSLVKVDSSANGASFTSTDQISGQTTQTVDDQWGFLSVYSNGKSWRIV